MCVMFLRENASVMTMVLTVFSDASPWYNRYDFQSGTRLTMRVQKLLMGLHVDIASHALTDFVHGLSRRFHMVYVSNSFKLQTYRSTCWW